MKAKHPFKQEDLIEVYKKQTNPFTPIEDMKKVEEDENYEYYSVEAKLRIWKFKKEKEVK